MGRGVLLILLYGCLVVHAVPAAARDRVVVLGFDGASAHLVEKWMAEGSLPNLARLRASGTYSPLLSTNPPQSPIAWASFSTGMNPGKTNQFDFLCRNPADYHLDLALAHVKRRPFLLGVWNPWAGGVIALGIGLAGAWLFGCRRPAVRRVLVALTLAAFPAVVWWVGRNLPDTRTDVVNNTRGTPFWQIAAEHGMSTAAIDVPDTFPPAELPNGKLLSGLGVPDIRGTIGTYTVYTTDPSLFTGTQDPELGGKVVVVPDRPEIATHVPGPVVTQQGTQREVRVPLSITRGTDAVVVRMNGRPIELRVGQWSDWQEVEFRPFPLVAVHGICRLYLTSIRPDLTIYMTPVNWSPRNPPRPISHPTDLAGRLAEDLGPYSTLGWKFATWPLNSGCIDERTYLEDSVRTSGEGERRAMHLLAQEPRLFVQVFAETDCMQHMFYRLIDEKSPAYDRRLAARYASAIHDAYRRMDAFVGRVQATLDPDDVLFVVSDHGFSPYRAGVNINRFLVERGYMAQNRERSRAQNLENLFIVGDFWPDVDWSRTRAYAFGLGQVYVNLKGREAGGIVDPGEYERVRDEIAKALVGLSDPRTGQPVVAAVWKREDLYIGPYVKNAPDLRVAFRPGYRVSWQDTMGGIEPSIVSDNRTGWSGDHCSSHPNDVLGVLFCSRPLQVTEPPGIIDLAPTILRVLGLRVPDDMDGKPLI